MALYRYLCDYKTMYHQALLCRSFIARCAASGTVPLSRRLLLNSRGAHTNFGEGGVLDDDHASKTARKKLYQRNKVWLIQQTEGSAAVGLRSAVKHLGPRHFVHSYLLVLLQGRVFKDFMRVRLRSGNGGDGCMSFRREANLPRGGPDGGNGGDGGSIYMVADGSITDLNRMMAWLRHVSSWCTMWIRHSHMQCFRSAICQCCSVQSVNR